MFEQTHHIDLSLPRSWNTCTTEQLETIAACIMKHTAMADRFHPYDWQNVKAELFFLLSKTEVLAIEPDDSPGGSIITCRLIHQHRQSLLRMPWFRHGHKGQEFQEFRLRAWQVQSWIDSQLKWLDDEKSTLLLFPYKHLIYTRKWQWKWPFLTKQYYAPAELLQDFTWQQYRHLQDYMELYVRINNQITSLQNKITDKAQIEGLYTQLQQTKRQFLEILFCSDGNAAINKKIEYINDIQWQVILLWWSGFMHYLKDHYPRCFKSSDKKKAHKQPNPLELYTSIVATMQKYIGIDEEKVNNQTFHIILEQLERIAKENEEIDKMNKKHKSK